jgi:hypothetical protein
MKNKEFKMRSTAPKSFKVLFMALTERKSSPSGVYTDWKLNQVRSAVEKENGDISVWVEFSESPKTKKSECYAITLPGAALLKQTADLETIGFHRKSINERIDRNSPDPYIVNYLYPLAKAEKACHKREPEKLPTDSKLPIVKLTVPVKDQHVLYALIKELKAQGSPKEKLYAVKFLRGEEDNGVETNNDETKRNKVSEYSDVLLIYWPPQMDQEFIQPMGIAGGYEYEDESTNLYYLLVPPAAVLDAIGIMVLLAAYRPM